jgi:hypothetical protein
LRALQVQKAVVEIVRNEWCWEAEAAAKVGFD